MLKSLPPALYKITIYGDRAVKEVMNPLGWALIQSDWYIYKKRKFRHTERLQDVSIQKTDHVRTQEGGYL